MLIRRGVSATSWKQVRRGMHFVCLLTQDHPAGVYLGSSQSPSSFTFAAFAGLWPTKGGAGRVTEKARCRSCRFYRLYCVNKENAQVEERSDIKGVGTWKSFYT